jgi:SLT domain-containing protein
MTVKETTVTGALHIESWKGIETMPKTSALLKGTHQTSTRSGGAVRVGTTTRTTHADRESEVTVEAKTKSARTRSVYLFSIHVDVPLT